MITPQKRWETELGKRNNETERIHVPYRFNSQKTCSTRDPSSVKSATRPKKKSEHVLGLAATNDSFLTSLSFKRGSFLPM